MSFTFVATQSIPIVSQRRISFATRTFVPTLSVHKERAYAPKSTRPVKCPILVSGLPKPRRRYVSAETRAAMWAAFSSWLTPASAYVRTTSHESGRGYFKGTRPWLTCYAGNPRPRRNASKVDRGIDIGPVATRTPRARRRSDNSFASLGGITNTLRPTHTTPGRWMNPFSWYRREPFWQIAHEALRRSKT